MHGWWIPDADLPSNNPDDIVQSIHDLSSSVTLVDNGGYLAVAPGGTTILGASPPDAECYRVIGFAPSTSMEELGDASFKRDHGLRYAYLAGAMANGIASAEIVEAMGRAGMLGFFGSAGLDLARIEKAIDRFQASLPRESFGFNLISTPAEPQIESSVVDLYLRRGVQRIEASAFLTLSLPVIRFRVHGIHQDSSGRIVTPNQVIAKISRVEVATKFFSPPPEEFLARLVEMGEITEHQAQLARHIPVAQDLTAEADSGGHTDNRPALTMLPTMLALRDRLQAQFEYDQPLRVGAAGGISTPASVAAAFSMGAAYVLSGTINQACVESGTSDLVRGILAQAEQADVAMAPAGDMFEMGVKVQVLKRGTLFAMRAQKLYDLYRGCAGIDEIPASERAILEKQIFRTNLDDIWTQTVEYFQRRDPRQIQRAEKDPKHKMALVFRWYLGQSSRWAISGDPTRQGDYQVWCGPAMGAFNEWTRGTPLERPENRHVVLLGLNLLYGGSVLSRVWSLRCQGAQLPPQLNRSSPLSQDEISTQISGTSYLVP